MAVMLSLPEGTMLHAGTYRIERFIGSGGFGCTYEAIQEGLDERVAVKEFFVKDFCNRDGVTAHVTIGTESKRPLVDKMMRKFIDEARALAHLKHNGIVRVRDVFKENGTAYYVMDYIDGCSLADLISRHGHLDEAEALRYIRQICEALKFVHDHNCLHLDIKPGNIMIGNDGNAILIDFGTAKQYDEANGENTSTLMGKTPGYAPLEQLGNNVATFHPSTDIYALGATLYKMLTGITPPPANMLAGEQEELKPLPDSISQPTRAALTAAMQLSGKKRPQSIPDFLSILDASPKGDEKTVIDTPEPTVYVTPPQPEPQPKPEPKKKDNGTRKIVIAFAAVAVIALLLWGLSETKNEPEAPVEEEWTEFVDCDTVSVEPVDASPTNVGKSTSYIGDHEYVDLGLSVKWATCNVGASSPEEYGDYYAWGETYTKSSYDSDNCETYEKNIGDIGGTSRDVAHVKWGGTWRMPTLDEIDELINNCDYEWATLNGVEGGRFTSRKNGKSIFLPAAGWRYGSSLNDAGSYGNVWSSTPYESNAQDAYCLYFHSFNHGWYWSVRYYGQSVRPVSE